MNQKRALPGLPRPPTPPSESGSGLERLRSFHNSDRGSSNIFSSTDDSLTKNEVSLAIKSARSVDTRVTVSTIGPDGVPLKKRRTGPGSRGVANLTPEQLAKKRANDREAQRAIRERTKTQIENLERRIKELTNQQPYQELQAALKEKQTVERELADIKRKLQDMVSMLNLLIGNTLGPESAYPSSSIRQQFVTGEPPSAAMPIQYVLTPGSVPSPTEKGDAGIPESQEQYLAPSTQPPNSQTHIQSSMSPPYHPQGWQSLGIGDVPQAPDQYTIPEPAAMNILSKQTKDIETQRNETIKGLDFSGERLELDFILEPIKKNKWYPRHHSGSNTISSVRASVPRLITGAEGAQDCPNFSHVPMKHDWKSTNIITHAGAQRASSIGHHSSASPMSMELATPPPSNFPQIDTLSPYGTISSADSVSDILNTHQNGSGLSPLPTHNHICSHSVKNSEATCPLDGLLMNFLTERRERKEEGLPVSEVVGPRYPSVSSLLNPARSIYSHPLSKVFTDILATFPDISALPERVAVLYIMFLIMRWQVDPTLENYTRMPKWARPLPIQIQKPHPAWIDHIPFPKMREIIIKEYDFSVYPFDNFFVPFTKTLSLNWPYEDTKVLLQNSDGSELMINPVFEEHLLDIKNWTLGSFFLNTFPSLKGSFTVKDRKRFEKKDGNISKKRPMEGEYDAKTDTQHNDIHLEC